MKKLTAFIVLLPLVLTLLITLGGFEHPLLFCVWLLASVVSLVCACFVVRQRRVLGFFLILASSFQIFLAVPPVLHIRLHGQQSHHEVAEHL